jgi:hypothetical protein
LVLRLTRVVRTLSSEMYLAWEDDTRVAQIDIHYAPEVIHLTVILERDASQEDIGEFIKQLDRDVVASYLQDFERENLLVSVFRGDEIMTTSDEDLEDEDEDGSW